MKMILYKEFADYMAAVNAEVKFPSEEYAKHLLTFMFAMRLMVTYLGTGGNAADLEVQLAAFINTLEEEANRRRHEQN